MAGPIPTRKISQLTAYGVPLAGTELLEIWVTNTSRRVTARDFVLPAVDPVVMAVDMSSTHPASRHIESSATVQYNDGGPGGVITFDVLSTGALPGNPTAQVGLAAVNGVAVTWMRSDAAPALSQSIAPTWTGLHIFANGTTPNNPSMRLASNRPIITWVENDAAADNRAWFMDISAEQMRFAVMNDAGSGSADFLSVDRTLNVVDLINLLATTVSVNGQSIRNAAILTSGTVATARLGAGVADATTWLRGDQTWQVLPGSFTGFANPTASVGLAAVNGAATTAMRSDAAPALSQSIAPTWTGLHIFANGTTPNNPSARFASNRPILTFVEADAAANNTSWFLDVNGEQFRIAVMNDAGSGSLDFFTVDRTLNVVDAIALTSTALTWNGNPISTAVGANPTGTVGLAAVNGVATTFLRSDAAPALSQAIVPTWTGEHTFTSAGTGTSGAVNFSGNAPTIYWIETDAAANNRLWDVQANSEQLLFQARDDAGTATNWLVVDRTAGVIDSVVIRASRIDVTNPTAAASTDFFFNDTNSAANERLWRFRANAAGQLQYGALNDALSAGVNYFVIDRTGITVDIIQYQSDLHQFRNSAGTLFFSATGVAATGASTPTLGNNKPGANAAVIGWLPVTIGAGAGHIPVFGN